MIEPVVHADAENEHEAVPQSNTYNENWSLQQQE